MIDVGSPFMDRQEKQTVEDTHHRLFSALKESDILMNATTWMNLEDWLLLDIRQSQKEEYYVNPLVWFSE